MSDNRQRSISDGSTSKRSQSKRTALAVLLVLLVCVWTAPLALGKDKKKKADAPAAPPPVTAPDFRKIVVFPAPPAIARLKIPGLFLRRAARDRRRQKAGQEFVDGSYGGRIVRHRKGGSKKPRFQLLEPYGLAVDSKGRLYVADTKVGAIFIFNTENNDVELIKHGVHAKFGSIFGLAMDDNDHLFVSDGELHHVLVFNAKHELEAGFGDDVMKDPNGLAIDAENRFLYVADTGLDQVLVYDADT